jgi:peptide deformylase
MLKIVQAPSDVLSKPAKHVTQIDKSVTRLLKQMEETLIHAKDPEGVGLAAPQVGNPCKYFIIKQTPRSPTLTFINPNIESVIKAPQEVEEEQTENEEKKGVQLEGCLSLKDVWGVVKREYGVVLSYQDEHGTRHRKKFEGFLATIVQHECDHLGGILFPKRVLEQHNQLYHSMKNAKGETEFEEIEI